MEEHVALDSKKQKKFVKSLKGIKKLMKETGALPEKPQKEKKPIKSGKIKKKKRPARGLVYLSHIPHGFYEHQMTEYFKQFGMVTNARVIRSKHTGRSKGHAFVEFRDLTVAQVVAETMNNYLMGKRLIKAVYIPPKDQRVKAKRKNWNPQDNPARRIQLNMKKSYNTEKTENEDLKIASKLLSNLTNTKNKLKELEIDYEFFTPVDVPEGLADKLKVKKEKDEDSKDNIEKKPKKKTKKKKNKGTKNEAKNGDKKANDVIIGTKQDNLKTKQNESTTKQKKQKKLNKDSVVSNEKDITAISNDEIKHNNKINKLNNGNDKTKETSKNNQKQNVDSVETTLKLETNKKQKLKEAGVKPLEDFISIVDQGDDDSDSTYQFDSDEFDNEIDAEDSESNDSNATDDDDEDDNDVHNEESDKDFDDSVSKQMPVQKNKNKKVVMHTEPIQPKLKQDSIPKQKKRKVPEKMVLPTKKPKFEKQNNKKLPSKQLKKKK